MRAFLLCQTQWRVAPMGGLAGLDYAGCKVALKAAGISIKAVFKALQVMESEVLEALSEARRATRS